MTNKIAPNLPAETLLAIWHHINRRVVGLGLERYDPFDILSHPLYQKVPNGRFSRYLGYAWRLPAVVFPFSWRRLLGIERTLNPIVFYHLGLAYLMMERRDPAWSTHGVDEMCQLAVEARLPAESLTWTFPYGEHHVAAWRVPGQASSFPPSCAHYTARLGRLFLRTGIAHARSDWVQQGIDAAEALLCYHRWCEYPDGSCSVSYYPDTGDEIINISMDTAALFSEIPLQRRTRQVQQRLNGLVQLVIQEQGEEGQWSYCSRGHYKKWGGNPEDQVDNHHTGMTLAALAVVLDQAGLSEPWRSKARQSLVKGIEFYLSKFFLDDGQGIHIIGRRDNADIVGYCEAVAAFYEILTRRIELPEELHNQVSIKLPKILYQAIHRYYNPRTGDVGSKQRAGLVYDVQSIRWGAGPLLQAIASFLTLGSLAENQIVKADS